MLVLVPTVPLLVFLFYSGISYTNERKAELENSLVYEAERITALIRDQISRSEGYVSTLALAQSARIGDAHRLHEFSRRLQPSETGISVIAMVDHRERVLMISAAPFGKEYSVDAIESVRNVFRTHRPDLSGPFACSISNRFMVSLTVPVEFQGETKYAIQAIIGTDTLSNILGKSALPKGWVAAVLDASGKIVARSHSSDLYVGTLATPDVGNQLANRSYTIFQAITKDGDPTDSILRPVGNWGWHVIVGVPKKTLSASLREDLEKALLISVFVITLCVVAAVLFSRKIGQGIQGVVSAISQVEEGVPAPIVETGIVELDQMGASILNVDKYNKSLEQRVEARTRELEEARRQAAAFSGALEKSVEAERQRISREVHDQIGSVLSGISLLLSSSPNGSFSSAQMKALQNALVTGIDTVRRISAELRPALLDDFGIALALRKMLQERLEGVGISCEVDMKEEEYLSGHQRIGCYRIAQEACTNVIRHSSATYFSIKGLKKNKLSYEITMRDNGRGFVEGHVREGALGIVGMTERARLLGGTLEIDASHFGGFALKIILPIEDTAEVSRNEISPT